MKYRNKFLQSYLEDASGISNKRVSSFLRVQTYSENVSVKYIFLYLPVLNKPLSFDFIRCTRAFTFVYRVRTG